MGVIIVEKENGRAACIGDVMAHMAKTLGAVGMVADGSVRDALSLLDRGLLTLDKKNRELIQSRELIQTINAHTRFGPCIKIFKKQQMQLKHLVLTLLQLQFEE